MAIPYGFIRILEGKKISLKDDISEMKELDPKKQMEFLMQNEMMKGRYLGECLDNCRWGSETTVMWETSVDGMIKFIQNWMKQNGGDSRGLFHERKPEELYKKFELPHIHYENCPRDGKHKETTRDLGGKVRCAHRTVRLLRSSFIESYRIFDRLSMMEGEECWEDEPRTPERELPDDAWDEKTGKLKDSYNEEYDKLLSRRQKFVEEEKTERVVDVCYAILSDGALVLPLETVLKRLNLGPEIVTVYCEGIECRRQSDLSNWKRELYDGMCYGHDEKCNYFETPFDGWTLASYVQKWHEQSTDGKAPVFEAKGNDELLTGRRGRRESLGNSRWFEDFEIRTLKGV